MARYDLNTTPLSVLLDDAEAVAILEQHAPGFTADPRLAMAKTMPVGTVLAMGSAQIGVEVVAGIRDDLQALN